MTDATQTDLLTLKDLSIAYNHKPGTLRRRLKGLGTLVILPNGKAVRNYYADKDKAVKLAAMGKLAPGRKRLKTEIIPEINA